VCGLLLASVCEHAVAVDIVYLEKGAFKLDITSVNSRGFVLADGRTLPMASVKRVVLDHTAVVAQSESVILKDGSRLSGTLQRVRDERIMFRSTTFGSLSLPFSELGGVSFLFDVEMHGDKEVPAGLVAVVMRDGERTVGELFAMTATRILLRNHGELLRFERSALGALVFCSFTDKAKVTLRNGDILNGAVSWRDGGLMVKSPSGEDLNLTFNALKEIRF